MDTKRKTIFLVDDDVINLNVGKTALAASYKVVTLGSGDILLQMLERTIPDLILLDVEMPEMNGYEILKIIKSNPLTANVPVIFLTAKTDGESELEGLSLGAIDYITKPFSPPLLLKRIEMHIGIDELIKSSLQAVRKIHSATITTIVNLVEGRDKTTGGHIQRTQKYLGILVDELVRSGVYSGEISNWDLTLLLPSAQLHDIGKICISDTILNKPGKLTDHEFEIIKTHCAEGEHIIDSILSESEMEDDGFLYHAKRFAGYHHERWDGTGYPRGLSGEDIPLEGRVMAVADVYDALVFERPYKEPFPYEQAVNTIREGSGTHFDPKIVEAFMNVSGDFVAGPGIDGLPFVSRCEEKK